MEYGVREGNDIGEEQAMKEIKIQKPFVLSGIILFLKNEAK